MKSSDAGGGIAFNEGLNNLTPEREARLLACIDRLKGATSGQLAAALDTNIPLLSRWLDELLEQGKVQRGGTAKRPVWERLDLTVDPRFVREEYKSRILDFLTGRRELASGIARVLGLPKDEVAETCKAMLVAKELVATPIGSAFVYARVVRGTAHVDLGRAASIPQSPAAQFRAQLEALAPEQPMTWTPRERPVKAPKPPKADPNLLPLERAAKKVRLPARQVRGLIQRNRVPHQGTGFTALVDVQALTLYKTRLRPKRVTRAHKKAVQKAVQAALPVREGYRMVSDAARSLGVTPMALHKWLENHEEARALCIKEEKYLMLPEAALTLYVQASLRAGATLVMTMPEGWPDIWQTVEHLGWSYSKVYKMLDAGRLTAVQWRGKLFFDPDSLKLLKADLDAQEQVPEGWVGLRALAEELNLDKSSVNSWMLRKGFEIQQYRDAQRQVVNYVSPMAAAAYRAFRQQCPGGVKITPEVRAAILVAAPPMTGKRRPPGETKALAERFGVSTATIKNILKDQSQQRAA